MELAISLFFTVIAVITASVTIGYLFWLDWKKEQIQKQTARDIPHTDSKWCKCYWCGIERIQNDEYE